MGKPFATELRERVLNACSGDRTQDEVADLFGIGRTTIVKWLRLKRETGEVAPRPHGGGMAAKVCPDILRRVMSDLPDGTRSELTARYNELVAKSARVHASSMYRALRRHGYVSKKNGGDRRNSGGRT